MSIMTRFVLIVGIHLLVRAWKNRKTSSNKRLLELVERWKTHPEEFIDLIELEMKIHEDWSST